MGFFDVLHRLGVMIGIYEPDEETDVEDGIIDEEEEEEWEEEPIRATSNGRSGRGPYTQPSKARPNASPRSDPQPSRRSGTGKVINMNPKDGRDVQAQPASRHSAIILYVRRKEESQQIISYVLEGRSVILNCEEIDDAQCQRVIDMLSGAAFALGGRIQRVSHRNYLFVPASVEIYSGEPQAERRQG